jgi:peroxiredoxin
VAVDQDGWEKVKPFIQSNGINYPILMYTESVYDAYQQLLPEAERGGIPFTFVIDRQGQLKTRYVGYRDKAVFEAAIKPLL